MRSDQQEKLFLDVIEQHKGIIYKIAKSFKKDQEDKNDLVQEIIFQLWRAFPGFDERSKLSTWMYRVALNVAISSYRKEKNKNQLIVPWPENLMDFSAAEEADGTNLNLLQQFINELKELDRALMLLYLEEKSGKEMAEILGLSEANIRTKINRIKEQLKQRFSTIKD
ncbi:MAG TPA: RNA polymerase sigma factor [Pedobacter sp.]|uniref:RNA polymerase sigma factor n=1 Tax=Pedobacter sp. TaxID=1411316 RepID=UPI002B94F235|nr:RNA polymerase sigma factor [Pedobacter sp.]HMI01787.1 RNA polymerase sigma factor [Pedobacter sp.]